MPKQNTGVGKVFASYFAQMIILNLSKILSLHDHIKLGLSSLPPKINEKTFRGQVSKKFTKGIQQAARRKLIYLDDVEDL